MSSASDAPPNLDFWLKYNDSKQFSVFYTTPDFKCPESPWIVYPRDSKETTFVYYNDAFEWRNMHNASEAPYQIRLNNEHTEAMKISCMQRCEIDVFEENPFISTNCTVFKPCQQFVKLTALFHRTWQACFKKLPNLIINELSASRQPF